MGDIMDLELSGKKALITGGSKGIGKSIAIQLCKEDVNVAIAARTKETLDEAAKEIEQITGKTVTTIIVDTTQKSSVDDMVSKVIKELGGIDILVNSAAMVGGQVRGSISEANEKDLIEDLDTKVVGYFRCIKAVVPHMQKQSWGRIISIGGVSARQSTIYGLRNAAVVHMTKTLSDQLGSDGITLNVIHPGLTQTPAIRDRMTETAKKQGVTLEDIEREAAKNIAIKRTIKPEELGFVAAFLSSPKAECITGESIAAGGGAIGGVFL
jgi:NAD(P)-dependent dehydrogenase (short-subunit alcohol dehydrogenase family)